MFISNSNTLNGRSFLNLLEEKRSTPSPGLMAFWAASEWKDPLAYPKQPLEIDKHIKVHLAKGRIDLARKGIKPGLLAKGPYWFGRGYLINCHNRAPLWLDSNTDIDFRERIEDGLPTLIRTVGYLRFLAKPERSRVAGLYDLTSHDLHLLGIRPDETGLGQAQALQMIDGLEAQNLAERLAAFSAHIKAALHATPAPAPRPSHRPTVIWKRWFVQLIGRLWRDLTGEEPSVSPGSKFADFVKAAWESLGTDMPDEVVCRRY